MWSRFEFWSTKCNNDSFDPAMGNSFQQIHPAMGSFRKSRQPLQYYGNNLLVSSALSMSRPDEVNMSIWDALKEGDQDLVKDLVQSDCSIVHSTDNVSASSHLVQQNLYPAHITLFYTCTLT